MTTNIERQLSEIQDQLSLILRHLGIAPTTHKPTLATGRLSRSGLPPMEGVYRFQIDSGMRKGDVLDLEVCKTSEGELQIASGQFLGTKVEEFASKFYAGKWLGRMGERTYVP